QGIEDWLLNIYNAEVVFTNSFHGVVFSLIFEKPFYVYLAKGKASGMNDRFITLLDSVGLLNRIVDSHSDIANLDNNIDWSLVKEEITKLRDLAAAFFIRNLN